MASLLAIENNHLYAPLIEHNAMQFMWFKYYISVYMYLIHARLVLLLKQQVLS